MKATILLALCAVLAAPVSASEPTTALLIRSAVSVFASTARSFPSLAATNTSPPAVTGGVGTQSRPGS